MEKERFARAERAELEIMASKSPIRFISWLTIASFSSNFCVIEPRSSLSRRFSTSIPEEKADRPAPVPPKMPLPILLIPESTTELLALYDSGIGLPKSTGCCKLDGALLGAKKRLSCGKQLGVVIPDICDICDGD